MKHNYNNYSKQEPKTEAPVEVAPEETAKLTEENLEEVEVSQPVVDVEEKEEETVEESLDGVVTALRLNIRKMPMPNAEVLTVVAQNTSLEIVQSESTADWYKVYTPGGIEGFCMKKFVEVK